MRCWMGAEQLDFFFQSTIQDLRDSLWTLLWLKQLRLAVFRYTFRHELGTWRLQLATQVNGQMMNEDATICQNSASVGQSVSLHSEFLNALKSLKIEAAACESLRTHFHSELALVMDLKAVCWLIWIKNCQTLIITDFTSPSIFNLFGVFQPPTAEGAKNCRNNWDSSWVATRPLGE